MADMKQSRISAIETPGRVNFNLNTLVRMAATLNVALMVKLVPFSEMLRWENDYSQDVFEVTPIGEDIEFINPDQASQGAVVRTGMQTPNVSAGVVSFRGNAVAEMSLPRPAMADMVATQVAAAGGQG